MSDIGDAASGWARCSPAGWIIGGGTLGHLLGGTPHANEIVVLISALVAGWASGAHPGCRRDPLLPSHGSRHRHALNDPDVSLSLVPAVPVRLPRRFA
jgi:hypothetical protein